MSHSRHRFNEIDLLRGVACLAVLVFHYFSRAPRAEWMSQAFFPAIDAVAQFGYLGVHLFFVISGFVILMSAQGATPREFVASRVARLCPALWVSATITAGTAWLLAEQRFAIAFPHFLMNLTLVPHWFGVPFVDGAYWSLAVELHFYIYVWIALRLKLIHRLEWLLIAWLCVSALNALRPAWPVELWLNAKWAPLFVAGGTFFLIRTSGLTRVRGCLLLASWVLAVLYAVRGSASDSAASAWICAGVITAIFAVFLAIAFDCWRMSSSRLTRIAGALTYPVYLIHQFFGCMLYELLRGGIDSTPIALGITTLVVLLISWAIHIFIEKPTGPLLRNWIMGRPHGAVPTVSQ